MKPDPALMNLPMLKKCAFWAFVALLASMCIHVWTGFFPMKPFMFAVNMCVFYYIWQSVKRVLF